MKWGLLIAGIYGGGYWLFSLGPLTLKPLESKNGGMLDNLFSGVVGARQPRAAVASRDYDASIGSRMPQRAGSDLAASPGGPTAMALNEAQPNALHRYGPVYQDSYSGSHADLFAKEKDRVRLLLRQAQVEVTSQLGLIQYQNGFQCPLVVKFDDAAAPGAEYALAYVLVMGNGRRFAQLMVINLDIMTANSQEDFDKIFYHEMTHAVLNDAVVSVTGRALPSWVQEGLAIYIDGQGKSRVQSMAQRSTKDHAHDLVRDLEDPTLDYARDYLAFQYMVDRQSINTLQAFVRDLTQGKSVEESIQDSTGMSWADFRQNVRDYSAGIYRDYARLH